MANFQSLLQTSIIAINKQSFSKYSNDVNFINSVIATTLLENTLENYLESNQENISNISELANNYAALYKTEVETLKEKYVSYKRIFNEIKLYNLKSLFSLTRKEVSTICELYADKQLKEAFSPSKFSQFMYNIDGLSGQDEERLMTAHYTVVCHIAKCLENKYKIKYSDIDLNLSDEGQIGRCIIFSVSGLPAIRVYKDIVENNEAGIMNYCYKVNIINRNELEFVLTNSVFNKR